MPSGAPWSQTAAREPRPPASPSPEAAHTPERKKMSPLVMTASMVGMGIVALVLVLFVLKPLLLPRDPAASKMGPSRLARNRPRPRTGAADRRRRSPRLRHPTRTTSSPPSS